MREAETETETEISIVFPKRKWFWLVSYFLVVRSNSLELWKMVCLPKSCVI